VAPGGWLDRLNSKIVMELMGFDPMTNLQGKRFGKGPTTNEPKCCLLYKIDNILFIAC
jgi:hypothetical protein